MLRYKDKRLAPVFRSFMRANMDAISKDDMDIDERLGAGEDELEEELEDAEGVEDEDVDDEDYEDEDEDEDEDEEAEEEEETKPKKKAAKKEPDVSIEQAALGISSLFGDVTPPVEPKDEVANPQEVKDYLSESSLKGLVDSEGMLNISGLTKVLNQVVNRSREEALRDTPKAMQRMLQLERAITVETLAFYKQNPDLLKFSEFIKSRVSTLRAQEPKLSVGELLAKAGDSIRETLDLPKKKVKKTKQGVEKTNNPLKNRRKSTGLGNLRLGKKAKSKADEIEQQLNR